MDVVIPSGFLGDEDEGELTEWLVADGAHVDAGQELASIETAKVSVNFESPAAGTISCIAEVGALVQGGTVLATLS